MDGTDEESNVRWPEFMAGTRCALEVVLYLEDTDRCLLCGLSSLVMTALMLVVCMVDVVSSCYVPGSDTHLTAEV